MIRQFKESDFWWSEFKTFLSEDKGVDDWRELLKGDEEEARRLRLYFADFLYNDGAVHRLGINFEDGAEISCGSEAPKIKVIRFL